MTHAPARFRHHLAGAPAHPGKQRGQRFLQSNQHIAAVLRGQDDGVGARLAGSANAYSVALFVGIGPVMLAYALALRGRKLVAIMVGNWSTGLAGGALQLGSYGIAIWAMTVAPIALVAALRETSVLFGAIIAVVLLKEPVRANRLVAALLIVAGLALIRLF